MAVDCWACGRRIAGPVAVVRKKAGRCMSHPCPRRAGLGQFMPLLRHNVPSLRHVQTSRGSHKPRHTSSYSTACSIRCNTKWRPSHRTPKLLFVLLPVAFGVCGRKRLHSFHPSTRHTGRNVWCAIPSFSQTVCPLCLQDFFVWVDLLDL